MCETAERENGLTHPEAPGAAVWGRETTGTIELSSSTEDVDALKLACYGASAELMPVYVQEVITARATFVN